MLAVISSLIIKTELQTALWETLISTTKCKGSNSQAALCMGNWVQTLPAPLALWKQGGNSGRR